MFHGQYNFYNFVKPQDQVSYFFTFSEIDYSTITTFVICCLICSFSYVVYMANNMQSDRVKSSLRCALTYIASVKSSQQFQVKYWREHSLKLEKPRCTKSFTQNLFSHRVINRWKAYLKMLWMQNV